MTQDYQPEMVSGPVQPVMVSAPAKQRTFSAGRVVLWVVLLGILGGGGYILWLQLKDTRGSAAIQALTVEKKVLYDSVVRVNSGQLWSHKLEFDRVTPFNVFLQGTKDTAKGFTYALVDEVNLDAMKRRTGYVADPHFNGQKVTEATKSGPVPAGTYYFVLANSENILNAMEVRVRLTQGR